MEFNSNELDPFEENEFIHLAAQFPYIRETEKQTKLELLNSATKYDLSQVDELFEWPVALEGSNYVVDVSFVPWGEEKRAIPGRNIIGRIQDIYGSAYENFQGGDKVLIEGASIELTTADEYKGVLAKDCNILFRKVKIRKIEYSDNIDQCLQQLIQTEKKRASGFVKSKESVDYELITSSQYYFLPKLKQVYFGPGKKPLFEK